MKITRGWIVSTVAAAAITALPMAAQAQLKIGFMAELSGPQGDRKSVV